MVNRPLSNSGAKEFILSLANKIDKSFSNHQTQKVMGTPVSELKNIHELNINGETYKHVNIYSTDFEAHSTSKLHNAFFSLLYFANGTKKPQ